MIVSILLKVNDDKHSNLFKMMMLGTANWMAPEAIMQKDLSRFSDIWSIGCIIIEMATGRPPWSEYTSQVINILAIISNIKINYCVSLDNSHVSNCSEQATSSHPLRNFSRMSGLSKKLLSVYILFEFFSEQLTCMYLSSTEKIQKRGRM